MNYQFFYQMNYQMNYQFFRGVQRFSEERNSFESKCEVYQMNAFALKTVSGKLCIYSQNYFGHLIKLFVHLRKFASE